MFKPRMALLAMAALPLANLGFARDAR